MRVNREDFLRRLESITPGLAQREVIEQSSCFIFDDGQITTFNDEVAASVESPIKFRGAVPSQPLLNLLSRLKEEDIDVTADDVELLVKGKGRRSGIRMEATIALPTDAIDKPANEEWLEMHHDFGDAIGVVQSCASNDDSDFVKTCVHITPDFMEATDDYQLARYPIKTGAVEPCLIRRGAIVAMMGLGMTHVAYTSAWIHFRNESGLIIRCRKWVEDYSDLAEFLDVDKGTPATLPPGLSEAVSKADVFSGDTEYSQVHLQLKNNKVRIRGEGPSGWYEEQQQLKYDGEPISFMISPRLLTEITKRTKECTIAPGSLRIDAGKFVFMASLGEVKV